MRPRWIIAILFVPVALTQTVDFTRDVKPILARCTGCHGPQQQVSGLRLDVRDEALRGGNAGALLVPGKSGESRLVHYLTGEKTSLNPRALRMPMGGAVIAPKDLATIRSWIDKGAEWPASPSAAPVVSRRSNLPWSFQPVSRPAVPTVSNREWIRNDIDAFVLARLEADKIKPSAEADRPTLVRRLSLDLIGLPPTPEEVRAFVADTRPDAYERVVDRLLGSPHFGERWGRFWLDQARYADSEGHELDRERPYGWRYRNWVIDSFNRDQPFDEFTIDQIAGDLLPNRTTEQWVATGFHRNALVDREGGTDPALSQFESVLDRTNAFSVAWLGLTTGCAQCHDHKFDPVTQKEFYQLMAFFKTFKEIDIDAPLPGEVGPYLKDQAEYRKQQQAILQEYKVAELQAEWEKELLATDKNPGKRGDWDIQWLRYQIYVDNGKEILYTPLEKRTWREAQAVTDFYTRYAGEALGRKRYTELKLGEATKKLEALKGKYAHLTQAPAMVERTVYPKTHVHLGGEYDAFGVEVQPGVPASLNPLPTEGKLNRLALAKWLVAPENPLTRRVAVNRIWQELFGRGIVRTSEDLGRQGSKPTHPELLDWLATEFLERGWSRKQIIREIVTSATYRQKSDARPDLSERDPENELLARQSRTRLPAELVRDAGLAAGGLLDTRIGGPSVRPFQPNIADNAYGGARQWKESTGGDRYRRGMYTFFLRSNPYPSMVNFDAPNANISVCRRDRSNTPLQALDLLNDPVFFEAAQGLAVRTMRHAAGTKFRDRLEYAYRVTLARSPEAREEERMLGLFQRQKELLAGQADRIAAIFPYDLENMDRLEGAAWVGVASVLLNLDEFITKE
jgi:hypothetical protein